MKLPPVPRQQSYTCPSCGREFAVEGVCAACKSTPRELPEGINISSYESGFAAALTNPTNLALRHGNVAQGYPVVFRGKKYIDAETAYQHAKEAGNWIDMEQRISLCTEVITAKLQQYPRLYNEICRRGGQEFIAACTHLLPDDYHGGWQGEGLKSPFINALLRAFVKLSHGKYGPAY